jgi:hypothetical protein
LRVLVVIVGACLYFGLSGHLPSPAAIQDAHIGDLVAGILEDMGAILSSFANGPDDPKGPVSDQTTLDRDAAHLDSATQKANQLASELSRLQDPAEERGR